MYSKFHSIKWNRKNSTINFEEDDSDTILESLRIFSTLVSQGNEYKIKMKNLNVPETINTIIEKMGIWLNII